MIEIPGWFGPPERALFGWICLPDDRRAALGVLLSAPIGEEEHNSHETFRRLSRELAARGVASVRFDHHGTGDSLGEWSGPGRVEAWLQGIRDANDVLCALGAPRTAALGMRIGATLLAVAAQRHLIDPDALVLWDPCSGRSMLREGHARRPGQLSVPEGAVDTPGYLFDALTVSGLHGLELSGIDPQHLAHDVLLMTRDDRPLDKGLRSWATNHGIEQADAIGQSDLLDLPMTHNAVPEESMEVIAEWLVRHRGEVPTPVGSEESPEIRFRAAPGEHQLTERVVSLGTAGLFGITTEPDQPTRKPLLVLINVANDRHVGPGRRWVDCARTWATMGFRVLRMDQSGTGDSPCHVGQEFGVLYAHEWLDDMPDALSSGPWDSSDMALISVCSGAYSAMETAMRIPIGSVYPINVVLHPKLSNKSSSVAHAQRLAARPPARAVARLHERHPKAAAVLWRSYRQFAVHRAPLAPVSQLVMRGTTVVLVMSPDDGRHFKESVFWRLFATWRWKRRGMYRLVVDRAIDHPLMTQEAQDRVVHAVTEDLLERYPATSCQQLESDAMITRLELSNG